MSVGSQTSQPVISQLSLSQLAIEPASQNTVHAGASAGQVTSQRESPSQPTSQPPPPQFTVHSDAPSQSKVQPPPSQSYEVVAPKSLSSMQPPSSQLAVHSAPRHWTAQPSLQVKSH